MHKKIKANTNYILSTLGGGCHGHLCPITDTPTYNHITPNNTQLRPTHPSPLWFNNGTAEQISEGILQKNITIATFQEENHIECTIINQVQAALDESSLMPKIKEDNGILNCNIIELTKWLFDLYGNISDKKIHDERIKTTQHKYVHNDSIKNFFNLIQTYSDISKAHGNPETNKKLIIIEKIITTKARIFASIVEKWNNKPTADQTWPNFKTHFNAAQINYKKARPNDTAKSHEYQNQANIVEVVPHEIDKHQEPKAEIHAQAESQHIIADYQANQAIPEANEFQQVEANASQ